VSTLTWHRIAFPGTQPRRLGYAVTLARQNGLKCCLTVRLAEVRCPQLTWLRNCLASVSPAEVNSSLGRHNLRGSSPYLP
jgi:hypothetical protein